MAIATGLSPNAWKWMSPAQGETEDEALANLKEALELHFEPPQATRPSKVRVIEVRA
jgi:hypothetical protein